jgi:hypothetical protein
MIGLIGGNQTGAEVANKNLPKFAISAILAG